MTDPDIVTIKEAMARLSMSETSFRRHVLPHIRTVKLTSRIHRIPVSELERWVKENAVRQ